MARLDGVREKRHQPFYDTLCRGIGQSSVVNNTALFGNSNIGDVGKTNLQVAGQLASDQTYVIKALRAVVAAVSLVDSDAFGSFGTLSALNTSAAGTGSRAQKLYDLLAYGAYFKLVVGDKPMFTAPLWYAPAGGGPAGFTTENASSIVTNGIAAHTSILKLGKEIHVPARQNFSVTIDFFTFPRLGEGQSAAFATDLSALDYLNQWDGLKLVQFYVDGVQTRDVQ